MNNPINLEQLIPYENDNPSLANGATVFPVNVKKEIEEQNDVNEFPELASSVVVKSEVADQGVEKSIDIQNMKVKARNYDEATLLIKPEFLIPDKVRIPCVSHLSDKDKELVEGSALENGDSMNEEASKVKLKGQNKHRPPPMKVSMTDRICPSLVDVGENEEPKPCVYQDKCNYRHDLEAYMKERKPDLISGGCYLYQTLGRCSRGISCCFGSEHLTPEGRNKINPSPTNPTGSSSINFLSKELQKTLRKKKIDFSRAMKVIEEVSKKNEESKQSNSKPVEPGGSDETSVEPAPKKARAESLGPVSEEDLVRLRVEEKKRIDWKNKLYLAPLTTVGNLPFRRLCKKLGADITCGEMAMAETLVNGGQQEWALVRRHSSEDLFGVQICGSNPYILGKCAQLLEEQTQVDFIDLNLGCPIDLVYEKGAGSGLMQRRRPLTATIRSLSKLLNIPFTVKMRTGVYANRPLAHDLVRECRDWGVSMVTVHGRSREQRYTKLSDWSYINQCVQAARPMSIFGNGDILSYEDYEADVALSGVDGVMIARGALMKPWIFTEIKERRHWDISATERFDFMKDFVNFGLEHWGSDLQGVERTRRFLLEWQSFAHRYVPVGVLECPPQKINLRPPPFNGRNDLETLLSSPNCADWIRISEMLLGPVPDEFQFLPKHKANSWK